MRSPRVALHARLSRPFSGRRLAGLAGMFLAACGTADGGGGGDGDYTLEEAFQEVFERQCRLAVACEDPTDPWSVFTQAFSCNPTFIAEFQSLLVQAVEDGRVAYREDRMTGCLDAFPEEEGATGCAFLDSPEFEAACESVLEGTVEPGGDCTMELECVGEATCMIEDACPGTCVPSAGLGDPCGGDLPDCGGELGCFDGTCIAPAEVGQPCGEAGFCVSGSSCLQSAETGEGQCVEAHSLPIGSDCGAWSGTNACAWGSACVEAGEGAYECAVAGGMGDACSEESPCGLPGSRCVGGSCVAVVAPGEPCTAPGACPLGFVCEGGACEEGPGLGESCDAARPCNEGDCIDGVCSSIPAGFTCDSERDPCDGGYCAIDWETGEGVCTEALGEGAPCESDEQCGDDMECRGPDGEEHCRPLCGQAI